MAELKVYNIGKGLGDCFVIKISNASWTSIILVDGRNGKNRESIDQIKEELYKHDKIDYLVITHIDADHIAGILDIMKSEYEKFKRTIIIYNYVTRRVVNYQHAKLFEEMILDNTVIPTCRKDYMMYSSPCLKILSYEKRCKFDVSEEEKNFAFLTLLYPDKQGIIEVQNDYFEKQKCGRIQPDGELVNRRSVVFLLEYKGKTLLFTSDCYFGDIIDKIESLCNFKDKKIDLIKIAHHGAKKNNLRLSEFAEKHHCSKFIVTGEERWNGKHPSKELLEELAGMIQGNIEIFTTVDMSAYTNENTRYVFSENPCIPL
ncbi:MAG: hypothetical protein HFH51_14795 [Lachnospiraceae bacterium]|nr:hypothetical protein [Lachnospiraceae bacterium]